MRVQISSNIDIWRHSNGHISVLRNATVTWLGPQVVLHVLCMLMWPWPDPTSRSRSRGFWTSDNYRSRACWRRWPQPPCGAFWSVVKSWMTVSCVAVCSCSSWEWRFLEDIFISQGRVETRLRCGGIFNYHFIASLLQSLTMKEFWKSVKIW